MTWVYKHTRSPGSTITAEYECPMHGRFTRSVPREESGDPPDEVFCRASVERYDGVSRSLNDYCGLTSPFVISAPARCRTNRVSAARRGKDPERPPGVMDWESLAYEAQDPDEWEQKEHKEEFDQMYSLTKAKFG